MKRVNRPALPNDWVTRQLQNNSQAPEIAQERRLRFERRHRICWAVVYGGFRPRRRNLPRRLDDSRFHSLDWHGAHLLAVAIGIVLLSVADAFLTITLLSSGAYEANPMMGALLHGNGAVFAGLKIGMTASGVLVMVALARYRFMRVVRVEMILYAILAAYFALIGYEVWLLQVKVIAPAFRIL
jgi:hypothetical protein